MREWCFREAEEWWGSGDRGGDSTWSACVGHRDMYHVIIAINIRGSRVASELNLRILEEKKRATNIRDSLTADHSLFVLEKGTIKTR